jgi:hypothetical protein
MRCIFAISLLAIAGCTVAPVETGLQATVRSTIRSAVLEDSRARERSQNIRHALMRLQARQPYVAAPVTLKTLRDEVLVDLDRMVLSESERADTVSLLNELAAAPSPVDHQTASEPDRRPAHEILTLILMEIPGPSSISAH